LLKIEKRTHGEETGKNLVTGERRGTVNLF
jgi:hypothetical protein